MLFCLPVQSVCVGVMESGSVLGWGRTVEGQLGLGGIEETTISEPRYIYK